MKRPSDQGQPEAVHLTADIIIELEDDNIILIKRGHPPYENSWAIPGGKLEPGETIETTAIREAKEETGLDVQLISLIGVYSKPNRDPRGRYISVAFTAKPVAGIPHAATDASDLIQTKDFMSYPLAFDHLDILKDYMKQKKR